ncbi:nhr-46 [Pristionchus pacificus]|uniref:Nuclear receptor n=1 Tax=Pristionchus pacificus TaxID=54126 RepID=A0A2A6CQ12_PRIPA|nr:nhr-46 [Pristionchus pacificus]|eukprot:PDM80294.1 nuclear receptor [Pristionchus pacificus]
MQFALNSLLFSVRTIASSSSLKMRIPCLPLDKQPSSSSMVIETPGHCVACNSTERVSIHYNALSCHGCKAFFRRTIFERREYCCAAEGRCEITDENRNQCRACRFQKCVKGGMNPKHVREERIKRCLAGSQLIYDGSPKSAPVEEHPITELLCALERRIGNGQGNERAELKRQVKEQFSIPDIDLTAQNFNCERIMNEADVLNSFYLGFLLLSEWAEDIPEFRALPIADQLLLFRQNFMVFGWLHYVYQSIERRQERVGVPLGNGSYIPYREEEARTMEPKWLNTYGVLARKLVEMVGIPLRDLDVDFEEYCILKTMSLFQIDNQLSPEGQKAATAFVDHLMAALFAHIERRFPHLTPSQRSHRSMQLTLLFPSLMQIGHLEALYVQQLSAALPRASSSTNSSPVVPTPSYPPAATSALTFTWDATPPQHNFTNCNNFLDTNPKQL